VWNLKAFFCLFSSSISLDTLLNRSKLSLSCFKCSNYGSTSASKIEFVSNILSSFFLISSSDYIFLYWYWLTPDASSMRPKISSGFILITFVTLPYMIRKWGLLTLSLTDVNNSLTFSCVSTLPLIIHLTLLFSMVLVTEILSYCVYPGGENYLFVLLKVSVTDALETEELPPL